MISIEECKAILEDASSLLEKGSDCVGIVKEITDKNADSYVTLERMMYNMKIVSDQLKSVKEVFNTIFDSMIIACILSVYAGKIEESGHWDEEDPDADSIPHIRDFIKMAFEYDIPKTQSGDKIADVTHYQLYQMMKEKYYKEIPDSEDKTNQSSDLPLTKLLPIDYVLQSAITHLLDYTTCKNKINKISRLVNTDDSIKISDDGYVEKTINYLNMVPYTIKVALMAAVYAGNIEGAGWGFRNEFGADSLNHLTEYLRIAEEYELPIDDDGKIDTGCVHTDISNIVHGRYNELQKEEKLQKQEKPETN